MPRKPRQKSQEGLYHIMCRSVSEFLLFREDEDKAYYLSLLKRYTDKYRCGIYAYCLMDNHLHLHFDARGFDVSKFMHSTNTAYVRYYNKKYNRRGHVFQERFESRILSSESYNLAVSAYIHNNAKDIDGYAGKEHLYLYSSYGIYLGIRKDTLGLLDQSLMRCLFNKDSETFIKRYGEFVLHQRDIGCMKKINEQLPLTVENEYRSDKRVIIRNRQPSQIISCITDRLLEGRDEGLFLKSKQKVMKYREFCTYVMRVLCGLSYREICSYLYNITASACAQLCSRGYQLIKNDEKYKKLFDEIISTAKG